MPLETAESAADSDAIMSYGLRLMVSAERPCPGRLKRNGRRSGTPSGKGRVSGS